MFKPKLSIPVFILIILTIGIAFAQLDTPSEKPIISPRKPAISSDGKMIAFVYQGDIWTVPSSGGHAVRLTDNVEQDTIPIFSPDGQWIAFSSLRTGNYDAFIVPTEGGTPRQMTFHGSDERATDWSPDGKRIIFSAYRDVPDLAMYEIDVNTLRTYVVGTEFKGATYASYSLDGKNVTYQKYGFPWIRPRYRGSASAQIWTIARETGKRHEVTKTDGQHLWPKFLPDGRTIISVATGQATPTKANFFEKPTKNVDNAARTPNLWAFDLNGRGRQITKFVGDSVKWPSVARQTGDIVFEYYDSIYLLKKGAKEPVKLAIFAATDDKENSLHRETVTEGVEEAEPSSDGKTILFRVNSDLWTVPVEKSKKRNPDDATRLTDNAGWDGDFNWTKDGKKIFFVSDREGPLSLFEMNPETQEVKLRFKASGDVFNPQITPDDKKVAFWVCDEGLYMMPIEGGTAVKVLDIPGTGSWQGMQTEFTFSPDMKWVAYINTAANNIADVWISPVKGGAAVNITRLKTNHSQVKWSPDGKYLFFQGDRQGFGLYVVPLKREPAVVADLEMKLDMPKDNAAVKVDIDFEDINLRIRKHNGLNPSGDLNILSDGTIIYINNGDVWSLTFDGKDSKRRTTRGDISLMRVLPDGKRAMLIAGRKMWMMDLDKYNLSEVKFVANWQVDARLELKAAFAQYWSGINRWYYDANFHGRDWAAIRAHYEPLLEGVSTRNEFADLLNMMMGEIDSSHAEVHPRPGG
ncbi:MAG: hypothetical protein WCO51_04000, partial [bacterium]